KRDRFLQGTGDRGQGTGKRRPRSEVRGPRLEIGEATAAFENDFRLLATPIYHYNRDMAASKIDIVGIGDDGLEGLTTPARQLVERAELLVGTRQSLDAVTASTAEKIEIG